MEPNSLPIKYDTVKSNFFVIFSFNNIYIVIKISNESIRIRQRKKKHEQKEWQRQRQRQQKCRNSNWMAYITKPYVNQSNNIKKTKIDAFFLWNWFIQSRVNRHEMYLRLRLCAHVFIVPNDLRTGAVIFCLHFTMSLKNKYHMFDELMISCVRRSARVHTRTQKIENISNVTFTISSISLKTWHGKSALLFWYSLSHNNPQLFHTMCAYEPWNARVIIYESCQMLVTTEQNKDSQIYIFHIFNLSTQHIHNQIDGMKIENWKKCEEMKINKTKLTTVKKTLTHTHRTTASHWRVKM